MIHIRLAKHSDLNMLANAYQAAYNSIKGLGEKWTRSSALLFMQYLHKDQPDLFFVVEIDGKVVGATVATVRPWWDGNHLIGGELFIHPNFQRKGIGVQLVKKLFETATKKYNVVSWDTYTHKIYEHPLKCARHPLNVAQMIGLTFPPNSSSLLRNS